ncbi:MAG: Ig-like domain-containing protein [Pseudomonadales bacterium]
MSNKAYSLSYLQILDGDDNQVSTNNLNGMIRIKLGIPKNAKAGDKIMLDIDGDGNPDRTITIKSKHLGKAITAKFSGHRFAISDDQITAAAWVVTKTGKAGKKVTDSSGVNISLDEPTLSLQDSPDNLNQGNLAIHGTATANSEITLYSGDKVLLTTKTNSKGKWSAAIDSMEVGEHQLTAKASFYGKSQMSQQLSATVLSANSLKTDFLELLQEDNIINFKEVDNAGREDSKVQLKVTLPPGTIVGEHVIILITNPDGVPSLFSHVLTLDDIQRNGLTLPIPTARLVDSNGDYLNGNYKLSLIIANGIGHTTEHPGDITFTLDADIPEPVASIGILDGGDENLTDEDLASDITVRVDIASRAQPGDILHIDVNGDGKPELTHILEAANIGKRLDFKIPGSEFKLVNKVVTATATVSDIAGNQSPKSSDTSSVDSEPPTSKTTSIDIDPNITADDTLIQRDSDKSIAITGSVTGEYSSGDKVTLSVNNKEFTGKVSASGTFSIKVPGSDLIADGDRKVEATVEATDAHGNKADKGEITDTERYKVDLDALDTDADEIIDSIDIDDDNDGILDSNETAKATSAGETLGDITQSVKEQSQWQAAQSDGSLNIAGSGAEITAQGVVFNVSTGMETSDAVATLDIESDGSTPVLVEFTVARLIATGSHGGEVNALFKLVDKDGTVLDQIHWHSAPHTDNDHYYRYPDTLALKGQGTGLQLIADDVGSFTTTHLPGNDWALENVKVFGYESTQPAGDELDTDGDGIVNSLDLDSDNDGITDNVEAQKTQNYIAPSGVDANGDGLDDAYNKGFSGVDSDGDGIRDAYDSDSDNDGTGDVAERGDGQAEKITSHKDTDNDGLLDIFEHGSDDDGYNVHDGNVQTRNGNILKFNLGDSDNDTSANGKNANDAGVNLDYRERTDSDGDGIADEVDLDDDNDGLLDSEEFTVLQGQHFFVNSPGEWLIHDVRSSRSDSQVQIPKDQSTTALDGLVFLAGAHKQTTITVDLDLSGNTLMAGIFKFHVDSSQLSAGQTGAKIDLIDSQGSVIDSVTYRAGQSEIVVLEGKGLGLKVSISSPDSNPFIITSMSASYDELGVDSDGDMLIDSLDIDSDNDGILDNVEAQTTQDYIALSTKDKNNNGLDDAYEGKNTLSAVDTDGDGTADFLDTDSDNDGKLDSKERGDGQNSSSSSQDDSDGDGLLDIFENGKTNDAYNQINENIIRKNGHFRLADSDNDVAANGSDASGTEKNLDYRDSKNGSGNAKEIADGVILGPDISLIQRGHLQVSLTLPNIQLIDNDGSEEIVAQLSSTPVGGFIRDNLGNVFQSTTGQTTLELEGWDLNSLSYDMPGNAYSLETIELSVRSREKSNGDLSAPSTAKIVIEYLYQTSPLVLDFDGDGVETIAYTEGVLFDIDGDGHKDKTGWAAADDGLLVRDIDANGIIDDASELFGEGTLLADGSTASDGFEALRDLDSNGDGRFDNLDEAYSELKVWRDLNQDGVSQAAEMQGLSQAGIEFIQLDAARIDEDNQGNTAGLRASWGDSSGMLHDIDDIWFTHQSGAEGRVESVERFDADSTLDLSDLLQGESTDAAALDSYLNFEVIGDNTWMTVSQSGSFDGANDNHFDKLYELQGVQLQGTDQQIIQQLLDSEQLKVDS